MNLISRQLTQKLHVFTPGVPPFASVILSGSLILMLLFSLLFQVFLKNLSEVNPTLLNEKPVQDFEIIKHGDVFTVIDRSFRFEFPDYACERKDKKSHRRLSASKVIILFIIIKNQVIQIETSHGSCPVKFERSTKFSCPHSCISWSCFQLVP